MAGNVVERDLHWPEFATPMPVRWLLSHQAGLPLLDEPLSVPDALAWEPVVTALAAQHPVWEPGTAHGYHALTYGWLVGEVVRRVSGRTLGTFFAEEIAIPLGLDFWIGLPKAELARAAASSPRRPLWISTGCPSSCGAACNSPTGPSI